MSRYLEHPSRVSRWRSGAFEVLPAAADARQVAWFAVEPEESGDAVWEGLLVEPAGPDRVVVAAVPVFAYDVNLGDEVQVAASADGPLVAKGVIRDAGRFTFRVWFPAWEDSSPDERWHALQVALEPFGCWFDVYSTRLVAVSAEPSAAQAVADFLEDAQRAGRFQYETGRTTTPRSGG